MDKIKPFSTTPLKIKYSINGNQSNENSINNQERINNQNDNLISQKKPSSSLFKKIKDLSVDWAPMIAPNDAFSTTRINQIIGWDVSIEKMDERFIPYINTSILYRNSGNVGVPYIPTSIRKNVIFEVLDIEGEDRIKNLNIHAGLRIDESVSEGTSNVLEAKLIIKLSNKLNFT